MKKYSPLTIISFVFAIIFFLSPLIAAGEYSFRGLNGVGHSLINYTWIIHQSGFYNNLAVSLRLALVTVMLVMVLLVPTVVYLHLGGRKWRRVVEFFCLIPIVIPVVSLAIGAQVAMPKWLQSASYELCFFYVIVAMPYVYRALDIGLQSIPLQTLVEASQSLGANWFTTLRRVILPAIASAMTGALFITIALTLGEYTLASLLHFRTFPTWVTNVSQENILGAVALSVATLVGAWLILLVLAFIPKFKRNRRGALAHG